MKIKADQKQFQVFFSFFQKNLEEIKKDPENVEELFAEYMNKNKDKLGVSDFEAGYIAGASFMGVLESLGKTVELLGKQKETKDK